MSCAHEIKEAVSSIMKFIPNIKFFVSPLLDSLAYYLRNNNQKKILTDVASKDYGCWQSTITVNAQTLQSHNEMDCTYTLISVPNQDKMNSEYDFFLQFNDRNNLVIPYEVGTTLLFNGYYLIHRQRCTRGVINECFINMASYGNKRLFNHIQTTLGRRKLN